LDESVKCILRQWDVNGYVYRVKLTLVILLIYPVYKLKWLFFSQKIECLSSRTYSVIVCIKCSENKFNFVYLFLNLRKLFLLCFSNLHE
jgi:hypothetical protein